MNMQIVSITSYICIIASVVACFLPLKKAFCLFVICAPLTTVAVFHMGGSSVLIYHIIWVIVCAKIIYRRFTVGNSMQMPWLPFFCYCCIGTLFVLFHQGVIVFNVDYAFKEAKFSFQQYTQLAYLFIGISSSWFTVYLLKEQIVSKKELLISINIGFIIVVIIGYLQLIVPANVINELFRNSIHKLYDNPGARISSTFMEPSMLSYYLLPMMTIYAVSFVKKQNLLSLVALLLSLGLCFLNNSSSAFLGLMVLAIYIALIMIRDSGRRHTIPQRKNPYVFTICAVLVLFVSILVIVSGEATSVYDTLFSKLRGEGVSGTERTERFLFLMNIFMDYPLFGVGWGTIRSHSLLSTWLASGGIVAVLLFAIPFLKLLKSLWSKAGTDNYIPDELLGYLIVSFSIMIFATDEIYYPFVWIMLGYAWSITSNSSSKKKLFQSSDINKCN